MSEPSITFRLLPDKSYESQSVYAAQLGDFSVHVYTTGTQATFGMALDDSDEPDTICLDAISQVLLHPPVTHETKVYVNLITIMANEQRRRYLDLLHKAMWDDLVQVSDELVRSNPMKSDMSRTRELIGCVWTCDQLIGHLLDLPEEEELTDRSVS